MSNSALSPSALAANALLLRGDVNGALAAYEARLAVAPDDLAALTGYASALRRAGRIDDALVQWAKALDRAPSDPAVCFNHANALRATGQRHAAEQGYRRALQLDPTLVPAWINLGLLLQDHQLHDDAAHAYAAALKIDPRQATAAMNRGNCLRQLGRIDEAIAQHLRAVELAPQSAQARYNLGNALRAANRIDDALGAWRDALRAGPATLELWTRLGVSLQDLGDSNAALAAFDRGRREHPRSSQAHCNFGHMAMRLRRPYEGIEALRLALRLEPGEPVATSHLVDALIKSGFISEAVGLADAALSKAQAATDTAGENREEHLARLHNVLGNAHCSAGDIEQALIHFEEAKRLAPDARSVSNLLFTSLYREDLGALQKAALHQQQTAGFGNYTSARARAVGDALPAARAVDAEEPGETPVSKLTAGTTDLAIAAHRARRLRVGYLSADLVEHPVGYFMRPLLRQHDSERIEVFVYSDTETTDALTDQIQSSVEHWHTVSGYSDAGLAHRIRSDRIDVLIELAGHTAGNRLPLLAQRVAPLQISYLGYPFSTGLAAVDAIIGDEVTTPHADAAIYREQVLRLPHFPFCMQPHATAPAVAPLPAARNGHLTFGCFNSLAKLGNTTLALWARLLHAVPDSRLVLRAVGLNDEATRERIAGFMQAEGIASSRLDLLPPIRPIAAYLDGYAQIDIALDPLAYNGGTTSFEALWQGVPVLTLPSAGFCARMGAGINATAGLAAFTARDEDDLLRIGRHWDGQREALGELRAGMRERLASTSLFDATRFMPAFEAALWGALAARQ